VIGFLVANSSLRHEDIVKLTIPQIELYAEKVGMFKIGPMGMVGKGTKGKGAGGNKQPTRDLNDIGAEWMREFSGL
jgi:hypothetical protein